MKVNFLKLMYHDKLGKVRPGTVAEIPEHQAIQFLRQGIVEKYETKVIRQEPFTPAGVDIQSSALPAAQVSQETTSKPSKRGGRPKKIQPSSL
jgi:hypothetical protein